MGELTPTPLVLPAKFAPSPLYVASMSPEEGGKAVSTAVPAFSGAEPKMVPAWLKVTMPPVGVPAVGGTAATVAVSVSGPYTPEVGETLRAVVVGTPAPAPTRASITWSA